MADHPPDAWRPAASREHLRLRAGVLAELRLFFEQRQVLEVETPLLSRSTVTDPHLSGIGVNLRSQAGAEPLSLFLQTSPEYAMKRLLANGSGAIYQLCKAFREDESGRLHNPEFTMLEWYRPGFDDNQLMDEIEELVGRILPLASPRRYTYRELFRKFVNTDPHRCAVEELKQIAGREIDVDAIEGNRDDWLNLVLSHIIEPQLTGAVFVTEYPASQAALARIHTDDLGTPVARRFELLIEGVELANGYWELRDAVEQRRRFEADNRYRQLQGQPSRALDANLLAALEHGLPDCAGVALGVDRLVMIAAGLRHLRDVLTFPIDRA